MSQRKNIPWKIWIPVFLIAGLVVDFYFLHFLFREKSKKYFFTEVQKMGFAKTFLEPIQSKLELTQNKNTNVDILFDSSILKNCLQLPNEIDFSKIQSTTDLFQQLKNIENNQFEIRIENYIFFDQYGVEHRLHITPLEPQQGQRQIRLFNIDSEGYPIKTNLPDALNNPHWEKNLTSYLKPYNLVFHQTKGQLFVKPDIQVQFEMHNDSIYQISLRQNNKVFNCQKDCLCQ